MWTVGFISCFFPGLAQDSSIHKSPVAVLAQLTTEHTKVERFAQLNDTKAVAEVQKDAVAANAAMMGDFEANFKYCPVYYFFDNNLDQIKNRHFDGVLMNADGSTATNLPINDTSKNYIEVYFGYSTRHGTDSKEDIGFSGSTLKKGLVICDYKLKEIGFIYKYEYETIFRTIKNSFRHNAKAIAKPGKSDPKALLAYDESEEVKYSYASQNYNISYIPYAKLLQKKIMESNLKKERRTVKKK